MSPLQWKSPIYPMGHMDAGHSTEQRREEPALAPRCDLHTDAHSTYLRGTVGNALEDPVHGRWVQGEIGWELHPLDCQMVLYCVPMNLQETKDTLRHEGKEHEKHSTCSSWLHTCEYVGDSDRNGLVFQGFFSKLEKQTKLSMSLSWAALEMCIAQSRSLRRPSLRKSDPLEMSPVSNAHQLSLPAQCHKHVLMACAGGQCDFHGLHI